MTTETDTTTNETAAKPARARRAKLAAKPARVPTAAAAPTSKSDTVIKLLLRAKGATPLELIATTDWQAHSVRAFLSGLRKKGRIISREARKSGEGAYRIVVEPSGAARSAAADLSGTASTSDGEA